MRICRAAGQKKLERYLASLMDEHDGCGLSLRMRTLIADIIAQWHELDRRMRDFDAEFVCSIPFPTTRSKCLSWARESDDARRLTSIPGVGVTIAAALIAAVGSADSFARSRDLAGG
jgi:transposase